MQIQTKCQIQKNGWGKQEHRILNLTKKTKGMIIIAKKFFTKKLRELLHVRICIHIHIYFKQSKLKQYGTAPRRDRHGGMYREI